MSTPHPSHDPTCIFCRIAAGEIPAAKVYEDEHMLAFRDINPRAPLHLLLIPREHIPSMAELSARHAQVVGHMLLKAADIVRAEGYTEGFRTVANTGRVGCQEVYHLHFHVLSGHAPLGVPPTFEL